MKRLSTTLIRSVLLLEALTFGSLDTTHAASHREAPMIDFDNKADINDVHVSPESLPATPSSNQVPMASEDPGSSNWTMLDYLDREERNDQMIQQSRFTYPLSQESPTLTDTTEKPTNTFRSECESCSGHG